MMWTLYILKTGSFIELSDAEADEAKAFYHLFRYQELWRNGRGDIYLWEKEETHGEKACDL